MARASVGSGNGWGASFGKREESRAGPLKKDKQLAPGPEDVATARNTILYRAECGILPVGSPRD